MMKRWHVFTPIAVAVALFSTLALSQYGGGYRGRGDEPAFTAESSPGTRPTATGTDAIGIGDGAVAGNASGDNAVLAIGAGASATGVDSQAIGENANATGAGSISLGTNADSTGTGSIALGNNADAAGTGAVAIGGSGTDGDSADANAAGAVAVGQQTNATGLRTVAVGFAATASANEAIAIGDTTDATGVNCIAIGGNATDSDSADCSAADSVAIGQHILADDIGEFAFASGEFSTQSDAHTSIYVLRAATTDDTQTEMFGGASAGTISVDSDCTNIVHFRIVARQANEDGTNAMYTITVGHGNDAGTTAELEAPTVTTVFESANASGWSVDTTADDTNDSINLLVTGAASDNINWVARAEVVESCG